MIISDDDLRVRLRLGEDSAWEFKELRFREDRLLLPSLEDLADEIVAFANAQGGTLLLGVADDGRVLGLTIQQLKRAEESVFAACRDSIEPPLNPQIHKRELDGAALLLVEVPAGASQHQSKRGSFLRVGSSTRLMTSDEGLRLAQRRSQARYKWFDEQPVPGTGLGSLHTSLWRPLLRARGLAAPEDALAKMGVLGADHDGVLQATVTGVLLCSEAPDNWLPQARITATRYNGVTQSSPQFDARVITGPLNVQITEAMAFVRRHNRVAAHKTPARVDTPEYSSKAVFEALVNAVVHRDYSIAGSAIRLMMFDDRLEISSPGSLPNNLALDSMASRQVTRNPTITSVIQQIEVGDTEGAGHRRHFVERRGDGVPIILDETLATSGKEASYRLIDDTELVLTIPAASLEHTAATAVVTVYADAEPVEGVEVVALFPNATWKRAVTDRDGEVALELYATHLPMTVFAAAPGYGAGRIEHWVPSDRALAVDLSRMTSGGSVIFPEASGRIPGLGGRLNPKLDAEGRTYVYATNVAIRQGQQQPVPFALGEALDMTDADGNVFDVVVVDIIGRTALLQYRRADPGPP